MGSLTVEVIREGATIGRTAPAGRRRDLAAYGGRSAGFFVRCEHPVEPGDLLQRRVKVLARSAGGESAELRLYPGLQTRLQAQLVENYLVTCDRAAAERALLALSRSQGLDASARAVLSMGLAAARGEEAIRTTAGEVSREGSSALLPVGLRSLDGSSVLGRGGHAFLTGGSNDVAGLFGRDEADPWVRTLNRRWIDLFLARAEKLGAAGIRYVQLVIPEKVSVLHELAPFVPRAPSCLLAQIERGARSEPSLTSVYVSALDVLASPDLEERAELFFRLDTHLTAAGCIAILGSILAALGYPPLAPLPLAEATEPRGGDLSRRLCGAPLLERYRTLTAESIAALGDDLNLLDAVDPAGGKHIGTRRVWRNRNAPVQMRAVAFGNSFFERGAAPYTLSWWCARHFQEFHFVWSPAIQFEYIDAIKPDLVVGQTIERFLGWVPES